MKNETERETNRKQLVKLWLGYNGYKNGEGRQTCLNIKIVYCRNTKYKCVCTVSVCTFGSAGFIVAMYSIPSDALARIFQLDVVDRNEQSSVVYYCIHLFCKLINGYLRLSSNPAIEWNLYYSLSWNSSTRKYDLFLCQTHAEWCVPVHLLRHT